MAKNYYITLTLPDKTKQSFIITKSLSIGSQGCDINLNNENILDIHAKLRINNQLLTVTFLGLDHNAYINKQKLDHGKMYILEQGDLLKFDSFDFNIEYKKAKNPILDTKITISNDDQLTPIIIDDDLDLNLLTETSIQYPNSDSNTNKSKSIKPSQDKTQIIISSQDEDEDEGYTEDEDAEEMEKTSFFVKFKMKIKNKLQKKRKQEKPLRKKLLTISDDLKTGLILRLIAFLVEFIIILFIYDFTLNYFTEVEKYLEQGLNLIPIKEILPYYTYLKFYLFYIIFEAIMHLIFGTSLTLRFSLFTSKDSFFVSRIKAVFRSIIGSLSFFTILLDLPLLFGKRSFKEILTGSKVGVRKPVFSFILLIIFTPLFIILSVAAPLLFEYNTLKETIQTQRIQKRNIKSNFFFNKKIIQVNNYNKLKTNFKQYLPNNLKMLAGVYKNKPSIYISDKKNKIEFIISPISFSKLNIEKLFNKHAPSKILIDLFQTIENYNHQAIITALKMNITNDPKVILTFLKKNGPFLSSYLKIKQKLIKQFKLNNIEYFIHKGMLYLIQKESSKTKKVFIINRNNFWTFNITHNKSINELAYLIKSLFNLTLLKSSNLSQNINIKLYNLLENRNLNQNNVIFDLNLFSSNPLLMKKNKLLNKFKKQTANYLSKLDNSLLNKIGNYYNHE